MKYWIGVLKPPYFLILIGVVAIPLLFSFDTVDFVLIPKFMALALLVIAIGLYARKNFEGAFVLSLFKKPYFISYGAYLLIGLIGLAFTIDFSDGIFEYSKLVLFACGIIFTVVCFKDAPNIKEKFIDSILISNFIVVAIGLFQFISILQNSNGDYNSTYALSGTFAHKNIFAEFLMMEFPFLLTCGLSADGKRKILSLGLTGLTIFLITVCLNRAVWLAIAFGGISSFIIYLVSVKKNNAEKNQLGYTKKNGLTLLVLIVSIAIGLFIYSRFDSFTTIKKQVQSIGGYWYGSGGERIQLWKKSIKVFKEHPLIGSGVGSWKIEVLKYGHQGLATEDNRTFHQRPHNDYLWILCEQGILGLLAYLISILSILVMLVQLLRAEIRTNYRLFYFACIYTLMGYLVFAFFSFPKERIEHQLILMFVFSTVIIHYLKLRKEEVLCQQEKQGEASNLNSGKNVNSGLFVLLLSLTIICLSIGYSRYASEVSLNKGYDARGKQNWLKVIETIHNADNSFYRIDPMCTPLSWYSGSAYFNMGNMPMAHEEFLKAYRYNTNHIHVLNNLGTTFELKGEHEKAIELYKKALEISPEFIDAQLNLTAVYFNTQNFGKAFDIYSAISVDTTNIKYMQIMPLVVSPVIRGMYDSISLPIIRNKLVGIDALNNWKTEIYIKSKANKIGFRKQVMIDILSLLSESEKNANLVEIKDLQKRFLH